MVHGDRTDPEMIVVAESLIPGNRLVEPRGLERFLIFDRFGSEMSPGTRADNLAVEDVNIPPHLVVLRAVAGIAQRDAEIEWLLLVKGVDRLDGRIENMRRIQHDP